MSANHAPAAFITGLFETHLHVENLECSMVRILRFLPSGRGVKVGVLPNFYGLHYCGSPTLRSNSANRGSECRGSSKKSVFKPNRSNRVLDRPC